jgi:uncharacterized membrane protein YkvA (DUF1232 family)
MCNVLMTLILCATALACLVVAVFAFKPDLRAQLMEMLGWSTAGLGVAATLSPIDLIPDILPGIGQLDDAVYVVAALLSAALAYALRRHRRRALSDPQLALPLQGGPRPTHSPPERR